MNKLAKYFGISVLGFGVLIAADKFKESDLVQKVVANEYKNLNEKTVKKIQPFIKGTKKIYVPEGIGFYNLIKKDENLKQLQRQYGWRNDEVERVYRNINGGNLDSSTINTIPTW